MIKLMVMEYILILTILDMKVLGKMINNMELVKKHGKVYKILSFILNINKDGTVYEGEYSDGKKNGKGKLT